MNKNDEIKVNDLFGQCEIAESSGDYEKIIELTDEVFRIDAKNPIAFGYRSYAYLKLNEYDKSGELLDESMKLYL